MQGLGWIKNDVHMIVFLTERSKGIRYGGTPIFLYLDICWCSLAYTWERNCMTISGCFYIIWLSKSRDKLPYIRLCNVFRSHTQVENILGPLPLRRISYRKL